MSLKSISLSCACALALSGSAWAHHSPANYEDSKVIQVTGTVTEYHFANPHSWIYMTAIGEDGEPQAWSLESGSTGQLVRRGWETDSLKPGDQISVYIKPLRSGAYGGLLGVVVLSDGTNLCDLEGASWPDLGTAVSACL